MVTQTTVRERWVFTFTLEDDLRFLSHHDTMRLFQRAFARAQLPVKYSEGFNPHAKISLPLPRPVGVASDCEAMVVELTRTLTEEAALSSLERQLPSGLTLTRARRLAPGEKLQPVRVKYLFNPEGPPPADAADRVASILASKNLEIIRHYPGKGRTKTIDLCDYLEAIEIVGSGLVFTLRVTESGTAKPAEIAALLAPDADSMNHRIRRLSIEWQCPTNRQNDDENNETTKIPKSA